MKVTKWIEIEKEMCSLMGWEKGIDAMVESKREVAPKVPIYELSSREDKLLLFKLRQRYERFRESKRDYGYEESSF
jgi:hypothetical protein